MAWIWSYMWLWTLLFAIFMYVVLALLCDADPGTCHVVNRLVCAFDWNPSCFLSFIDP